MAPIEEILPQQWALRDRWCIWPSASFSFYTSLIHRSDWLRKRLPLHHKSTHSHTRAYTHTTAKHYYTRGSWDNDLISHWQKVQWYCDYWSPHDPRVDSVCVWLWILRNNKFPNSQYLWEKFDFKISSVIAVKPFVCVYYCAVRFQCLWTGVKMEEKLELVDFVSFLWLSVLEDEDVAAH